MEEQNHLIGVDKTFIGGSGLTSRERFFDLVNRIDIRKWCDYPVNIKEDIYILPNPNEIIHYD